MASSLLEEIKNRLDIVEVVSEYVKLQRAGSNFKALCPFHKEKTPSFFVSPSKQIWKCFGCGRGGSVIDFVMEIEGIEFREALKILAKRAGLNIAEFQRSDTEREKILEALELSCKFFEKQLHHSKAGEKALEYLRKRGLKLETIFAWRLGWAPDTFSALSDFLRSRGFTEDILIKSGLSLTSEKGLRDRFYGRIMFPIFSLSGQVIGYTGRVLAPDREPKYLNGPNTPVYDKGRILYGLYQNKTEVLREKMVIVVEGTMDVLLSWQEGIRNIVSPCGSAGLTLEHFRLLGRYTDTIIFSFDSDEGGQSGTERGIELALSQDFKVKAIVLPPGKDPADVIMEDPKNWRELVSRPLEILDYFFQVGEERFDKSTVEGKERFVRFLLGKVKSISSPVRQSLWLERIAERVGLLQEDLRKELERIKERERLPKDEFPESSPEKKEESWEDMLLRSVYYRPQLAQELQEKELSFLSERARNIIRLLREKGRDSIRELGAEDREYLEIITFYPYKDPDTVDWEKEFRIAVQKGFLKHLSQKIAFLKKEIKSKELRGESSFEDLLSELKLLTEVLRSLSRFKQ